MKNTLQFEQLEPRLPCRGFADSHVTVSFAPDCTMWGANGMTAEVSTMWRECVLEALEEWDRVSGLTIELVDDDGSARQVRDDNGRVYAAQGEAGFGDLRIAAAGEGWNDGSTLDLAWYSFMPSGTAGGGDQWIDLDHPRVQAIMDDHEDMHRFSLHLTGRMLGLPAFHRAPAGSLMASGFSTHELTEADIAAVQALYGPPEEVASKEWRVASEEAEAEVPPVLPRRYPTAPAVTIGGVKMFI